MHTQNTSLLGKRHFDSLKSCFTFLNLFQKCQKRSLVKFDKSTIYRPEKCFTSLRIKHIKHMKQVAAWKCIRSIPETRKEVVKRQISKSQKMVLIEATLQSNFLLIPSDGTFLCGTPLPCCDFGSSFRNSFRPVFSRIFLTFPGFSKLHFSDSSPQLQLRDMSHPLKGFAPHWNSLYSHDFN